jgi:cytidyltransferase-like protein
MKKTPPVLVSGSFDDIRSRHLRLLEEAAKLGPVTVRLWSDAWIQRMTGQPPRFPAEERLYYLRAVRFVTQVEWQDSDDASAIQSASPGTIWAVDGSLDNADARARCEARGLKYRAIPELDLTRFPDFAFTAPESTGRKRVIVTGCYDWFHSGHVRFCEEASQHGDLYVVVGHDANIRLLKGAGRPLFPQRERRYILGTIRFVKAALISSGNGWLDAEPEMRIIRPDIYAVNEDGDVPEKREYCRQHGIEYLVLKRAPAPGLPQRSSTTLRGY